jgi:hypothetical protein
MKSTHVHGRIRWLILIVLIGTKSSSLIWLRGFSFRASMILSRAWVVMIPITSERNSSTDGDDMRPTLPNPQSFNGAFMPAAVLLFAATALSHHWIGNLRCRVSPLMVQRRRRKVSLLVRECKKDVRSSWYAAVAGRTNSISMPARSAVQRLKLPPILRARSRIP